MKALRQPDRAAEWCSRPKVNIALTQLQKIGTIKCTGSKLTCDIDELEIIADME